MRGNAKKYPDKQISVTGARNNLLALLMGCTDAKLASFTVDGLTALFRVPETQVADMLERERNNRRMGVL